MCVYIQLSLERHTLTRNVFLFCIRVLRQIYVEITCEFSNCFRCLHFSFLFFVILFLIFFFFLVDAAVCILFLH